MILSLSIVIIAAVLASVALFFLLGSNVNQAKKQNILVIVGSLILLSIIISNFKSNDLFKFSLLNSSSKNKLNTIFSADLPQYSHKYNFQAKNLGDYLFNKNYVIDQRPKDYNQYIIYVSNKGQGGSYFIYQLVQRLRNQGIPSFYVKLQSPSGSSKQFYRKTGLNSYQAFKSAIQYYIQQRIKPYIIIDNAEKLPQPILDILASFDQEQSPHIIFNTQNADILLQRISQLGTNTGIGNLDSFLKKFQVQKFIGPDLVSLEKLSPTNTFIKRLPMNFQNIFQLKNGATEEELLLKNSNVDSHIAGYFGINNYYNQVKRALERGPISFGRLRQMNITYEIIQKMQNLRLLTIQNGQVNLQ